MASPKSPLRVVNIDTEDFTVNYAGKPYTVKSGDISKPYKQHIALHIAKHLVDKILNKKGIKTNKEPERGKIFGMVLTG